MVSGQGGDHFTLTLSLLFHPQSQRALEAETWREDGAAGGRMGWLEGGWAAGGRTGTILVHEATPSVASVVCGAA